MFELSDTDLLIPRGFQSSPALLKLGGVGLGEVIVGVAQHAAGARPLKNAASQPQIINHT
ncbi:MAG: hypothetical protein DMG16_30035 [Acidobacteria bacterium]|nr:MAG: hypothetical protein DMG16_30035 [Acidobacteriota bacterium]